MSEEISRFKLIAVVEMMTLVTMSYSHRIAIVGSDENPDMDPLEIQSLSQIALLP
jgi:hypothetical protein